MNLISGLPELTALTPEPRKYCPWLAINHGVASRNLSEGAEKFLLASWTDDTPAMRHSTAQQPEDTESLNDEEESENETEESHAEDVNYQMPSKPAETKSSTYYDPVRDRMNA